MHHCPSCDDTGIRITAFITAQQNPQGGFDSDDDFDYEPSDAAICNSCGWDGQLGDTEWREQDEDKED